MKTRVGYIKTSFLQKCLIIFFAVASIGKLKSQELQKSRAYSYYTYIYTINNNLAKNLLDINGKALVKEELLLNPIDSFLTDSGYKKKLIAGNYLYVSASGNNLHYKLKSINNMDAYLYVDKKRILFFPYTKSTLQPIADAVVKLNKHKAKYDPQTRAYKLKGVKEEGFITVTSGNEEAYFSIEKKEKDYDYDYERQKFSLKKLFKKSDNDSYYRRNNTNYNNGYIAFNKPKYLPKDTVKFKALILTKKGKYYMGDVDVMFGRGSNNKKLTTIKAISPGAYVYQFVLGDSLTVDENYYVEMHDAKSGKQIIVLD